MNKNNPIIDEYMTPEKASAFLKVSKTTLINWEKDGKLSSLRTTGGHRRYKKYDLAKLSDKSLGKNFCYCRVSTKGHIDELDKQIEFFKTNYPSHIIISDIGSAVDFERQGFNILLQHITNGNIAELVIHNKDTLCSIGYNFIETLIKNCSKGNIVILNDNESLPAYEAVKDLNSMVNIFASKLSILDSTRIKKSIKDCLNDKEEDKQTNGQTKEKYVSDIDDISKTVDINEENRKIIDRMDNEVD